MNDPVLARLACPECRGGLQRSAEVVVCHRDPAHRFAIHGGTFVLLTRDSSVRFEPSGSGAPAAGAPDGAADDPASTWSAPSRRRIDHLRQRLPSLGLELGAVRFDEAVRAALADRPAPEGLLIGAGTSAGRVAARFPGVSWLATDVYDGPGVAAVAEVGALPLPDASVDLVVAEHVLEHVLDPWGAAREIERVLRPGGIVAVKTPFAFPHHGAVDLYRFTLGGLRALFPRTERVEALTTMGSASALAYGIQTTTISAAPSGTARRAALVAARLLLAPLKHLDRLRDGGGFDGFAAAVGYVGRRVDDPLSPGELVDEARALCAQRPSRTG